MKIQPEIIRSKRKTITLTVDNTCRLTVKAPLKMPLNEINKFIALKENWINEKLAFYKNINESNAAVSEYSEILYLGQKHTPAFAKTKYIYIEGREMFFPLSLGGDKKKFLNALKRWYKEAAEEYASARALTYGQIMKADFQGFKITDSKRRWGSCDNEGNISFNFRVLALPPQVIDYIIVHELAHLRHLNHSAEFWSEVAKFFSDYKNCRKTLKSYNYIMNLFRK